MHYHTDGFSLDEFNTKSGYDDPPAPDRFRFRCRLSEVALLGNVSDRVNLPTMCVPAACTRPKHDSN
jgi:hypothetical protein